MAFTYLFACLAALLSCSSVGVAAYYDLQWPWMPYGGSTSSSSSSASSSSGGYNYSPPKYSPPTGYGRPPSGYGGGGGDYNGGGSGYNGGGSGSYSGGGGDSGYHGGGGGGGGGYNGGGGGYDGGYGNGGGAGYSKSASYSASSASGGGSYQPPSYQPPGYVPPSGGGGYGGGSGGGGGGYHGGGGYNGNNGGGGGGGGGYGGGGGGYPPHDDLYFDAVSAYNDYNDAEKMPLKSARDACLAFIEMHGVDGFMAPDKVGKVILDQFFNHNDTKRNYTTNSPDPSTFQCCHVQFANATSFGKDAGKYEVPVLPLGASCELLTQTLWYEMSGNKEKAKVLKKQLVEGAGGKWMGDMTTTTTTTTLKPTTKGKV